MTIRFYGKNADPNELHFKKQVQTMSQTQKERAIKDIKETRINTNKLYKQGQLSDFQFVAQIKTLNHEEWIIRKMHKVQEVANAVQNGSTYDELWEMIDERL